LDTQPPLGQTGHPSRLKIGTLARPLPAFNCSEEVFAIDIMAESRLAFCLGHTVQRFAMVNGKQVCRYHDVSKQSQTRGHSVRIVWQFEAQKKCVFVSIVSVQAKPLQKDNSAGHTLAARARQCSTTCTTVSVSVPHNRHVVCHLTSPSQQFNFNLEMMAQPLRA